MVSGILMGSYHTGGGGGPLVGGAAKHAVGFPWWALCSLPTLLRCSLSRVPASLALCGGHGRSLCRIINLHTLLLLLSQALPLLLNAGGNNLPAPSMQTLRTFMPLRSAAYEA
jgi:hypothetical protein